MLYIPYPFKVCSNCKQGVLPIGFYKVRHVSLDLIAVASAGRLAAFGCVRWPRPALPCPIVQSLGCAADVTGHAPSLSDTCPLNDSFHSTDEWPRH